MTEKELKHSLGRLIMPRLMIDEFATNAKYRGEIERYVRTGKAGGFCVFGGTPELVRSTIETLQSIAQEYDDLPLLFSCDAEWGLTMRLREGGTEFPHARAFAKVKDATLIEEAAYRIGMELRALHIEWNFAPVVDVNTNPHNPIINIRSYGETVESVIRTATIVLHGIRKAGVAACAKHFPGHGDTLADSHRELPIITHGAPWMLGNDLPPFSAMIQAGIPSIMTGHIAAPSLAAKYGASGKERQLPATLSKAIISGLLRTEMRFDGVVVSDSLEMGAIRKVVSHPGEAGVMAVNAGVDVLLMPPDPVEVYQSLWRAIDSRSVLPEQLEHSILRVKKLIQTSVQADRPSIEETFGRGRTRTLALKIAEKALKIRGNVKSLQKASDILFLCSEMDAPKAEHIKTLWTEQGVRMPINIIRNNFDKRQELSDSSVIVIYDRPHGVLGAIAESQVSKLLRQIIHRCLKERIRPLGIIFLGNPYLDELLANLSNACTIYTYSATEPSAIVIGNLFKHEG